MDSQPSTSSGEMDQRRKDALKAYRAVCCVRLCPECSDFLAQQKMKDHETNSETLKNRELCCKFMEWKEGANLSGRQSDSLSKI